MQIAGIKKTTLLDYPGHVACLIFTSGCNFRCPQCYNPEFVLPERVKETNKNLITEEAFFGFLDERKYFLDGVVICGGEPTVQGDIIEFIKKIKEKGFLVKLDTNGTNPDIIKGLLDNNLVDYIAMDIKHTIEDYDKISGIETNTGNILKSIALLKNSNIQYEFRTTVISGYHDIDSIRSISNLIKGSPLYAIQNFIGGNTLDPNFDGRKFTDEQMIEMQKEAEKYVEKCEIR